MLRSNAPSVINRKRNDESPEICNRTKKKRVNYCEQDENDENEDADEVVKNYNQELITAGVSGFNEIKTNRTMRDAHEDFIKNCLSRPFKMVIKGYFFSGKPLGARSGGIRRPLYDPDDPHALIFYAPPFLTETQKLKVDMSKIPVHVLLDPRLSRVLRPHQRAGVKFLYDCVTGKAIEGFNGCIMADDMGLGKTLQCVALIWTLVRQGPDCKPIAPLTIVVSPSSLVKNWQNEFKKWLGDEVSTVAIDGGGKKDIDRKLEAFCSQQILGRVHTPVLFISYETFRLHAKVLNKRPIGLMICDEGHRLKNPDSQTYLALDQLDCQRRVLLSGTPIQNDLLEYYSLVHFVNRNLLGTSAEFRKEYENPILKSRDADCTDKEKQKGQDKIKKLLEVVNRCMIRRTNDILSKYLPPKVEMVITIPLIGNQKASYIKFVKEKKRLLDTEGMQGPSSLQAITALKKLCNHPALVYPLINNPEYKFLQPYYKDFKPDKFDPTLSGKFLLLDLILAITKMHTDDKFVLVSNYTQTLDTCQELCKLRGYGYVRLDGTMAIKKRSKLVAEFNSPESSDYVFMLSSKAGGCGLNLIGANRLIMFDPDWNPANDDQAMARVWRDGQKKRCFIYRLVTAGTIEEKMLQRQLHKKALSGVVVDNQEADNARRFSSTDMKEIFSYKETASSIHESLKCKRCHDGMERKPPPKKGAGTDLGSWNHASQARFCPDIVLKKSWERQKDIISFLFHQQSHEQVVQK